MHLQNAPAGSSTNAYVLAYEKVFKKPIRLRGGELELAYDEIKAHNTPAQYRAIWMDNHRFMVELHLLNENYSKGFMKFACNNMRNSPITARIALLSEVLYTVVYHSETVGDLP